MSPRTEGDLLASAARTASTTSEWFYNSDFRGVHVTINVTAVVSSPSVTFKIQGLDRTSGNTYDLLASAAITGTGQTELKVYPGLTASANAVASDVLPRDWRISATHGNGNSITYSVGFSALK